VNPDLDCSPQSNSEIEDYLGQPFVCLAGGNAVCTGAGVCEIECDIVFGDFTDTCTSNFCDGSNNGQACGCDCACLEQDGRDSNFVADCE